MNGITIVSAFFDCGRGNLDYQTRKNEKYIEYFKFWARIKNPLIIYTEPGLGEKFKAIRNEYELSHQTSIIEIQNIWEIEQDIYCEMCKIEKKGEFIQWRLRQKDISNTAKYSYIMMMKYWFMKDAVERGLAKGMVAWLDIGFNHGGDLYIDPEEFAYEWQYDFDPKFHIFYRKHPDHERGLMKLIAMTDSFMGAPVLCPDFMCNDIYHKIKDAMNALISLDCFDDDQMLTYMVYRLYPDLFAIHESDWFWPLKEYGGGHLSVKSDETAENIGDIKKENILKKIFVKYSYYKKHIKNLIRRDKITNTEEEILAERLHACIIQEEKNEIGRAHV